MPPAACVGGLDGAGERGGGGVADRPAVFVQGAVGEHAAEFGLAGFGAAVFLLAFAACEFMGDRGHTRAIELKVGISCSFSSSAYRFSSHLCAFVISPAP